MNAVNGNQWNSASMIEGLRQKVDTEYRTSTDEELEALLQDNPDRLSVINWKSLVGLEPPPRFWHLPEWHGDSPTGLFGAGGKGKSIVAQTVGTALSMGLKYFVDAPAAPVNVLYWACEDDRDEIWRRQAAINRHFDIDMADISGRFYIDVRRGIDNTLFTTAYGKPMFTSLREELAEQVGDYKASILILDNIAQVFGGNANDPHHVTGFVNGVSGIGIGKVARFAPMLLGHVARSQGSEFAGSAAWENACRMRWYLGSTLPDQSLDEDEEPDPDTVYLAKRKSNYSARDFVKLTYRNGVMVPSCVNVTGFEPGAETAELVVLSCFDKVVASGVIPTDGRTSPDYLPAVIKRMDLSRTFTKKELASAMSRLMGQGRLKRVQVGQYANRNPTFRLSRV